MCCRRNIAILDRHTLTGLLEQTFLLRPHVGDRDVEPADAAVQCVDEACEPRLQRLSLSSASKCASK